MKAESRTLAASAPATALTMPQRRQIGIITVAAIAVFAFLRWLPTGTNLSHMDFRVDAKNSIDFCDPLNPQFIPVVAVASPVSMTVSGGSAATGKEFAASVHLQTASGKPIGPQDLLIVHTERLHLLIVDPTLQDYQHVHPTPGRRLGDWNFQFTPRREGTYRIFADFTPAATARGLYASTDVAVDSLGHGPGDVGAALRRDSSFDPASARPGGQDRGAKPLLHDEVVRDGYHYGLRVADGAIHARKPADLRFSIVRTDGGAVPMEPVMGAFAHLVAFDQARSGFAHLHPMQTNLAQRPDATNPTLDFKITIPAPGPYVIWAQVNLAGREEFVPFWVQVSE